MSKKSKKSKKRASRPRVSSSVAAAMRDSLQRGSYGAAIANKAMAEALGKMTLGMYSQKSPKKKLTPAEKKARARVLSALRGKAARAARLSGKKKRSKVAPRKQTRVSRVAAAPKKPSPQTRVKSVTAEGVIKAAAQAAMKRWLCEGPRRSGCGAGGTRVVTGSGSFKRIRPLFMTSMGR